MGLHRRILLLTLAFLGSAAYASSLTFHAGPAAAGNGGPNPLDIPPVNPTTWEAVWVRDNHTEWTFGLIPGIFFGYRNALSGGTYVSMGYGGVISTNGIGPGIYAAFGADLCGILCFNFEYKKALGVTMGRGDIISPYGLRVGVTLDL